MAKRHLITCALPYANGAIHIGHIAGCFLPSDIYARYQRLKGQDVLFVCGTDEHGVPITLKAKKEGKLPQDVVDENYKIIKGALQSFGMSFDNFSRTTNPVHHQTAKDFFKVLYDKGVFIENVSEQLYDEKENQFLADRYVVGTCPNCSFENAYGDQCENCGKTLSPKELINPSSALSGNKPIVKETKNWYLPLDDIQLNFLNAFVDSKKGHWKSNVFGQCKSWLNDGLKPRAMTRDLNWGVSLPIENTEGKVMYVWFDAPIGYISATKEISKNWEEWWKNKETELTHFLGKDNIVFHTIIFPAMLYSHGEYILPTNVPANEFLNLEGKKLSTSRNHAIWLHEYLKAFPGKSDELRFVLNSILPETKDSDFTWNDFQARVNNELVAIMGNFVNRVFVLCHKYFEGQVPLSPIDEDVNLKLKEISNQIENSIEGFKMRDALGQFMELSRLGNVYLQDKAPWHLVKESGTEDQVKSVLRSCLEIVKTIGFYSEVFLPNTAKKLYKMLNINSWEDTFNSNSSINTPTLLFEKIETEQIEEQKNKLNSPEEEINHKPIKEMIGFEDFSKLDLRVGTIISAEKVEKADKLLKLSVDLGFEKRTVVSGIAEHYSSEEIIGQQVCLLANLAPKKLRGIESQGMILMAEDEDGKLRFVNPSQKTSNGSSIA